jgi:exopolysaccharide production protein ExoZ
VVVHHVSELLTERLHLTHFIFGNGSAGVDVFFVISGVVMVISSRSLAGCPDPGKMFLRRRVERIVPLYWMATTIKLCFVFAAPALVGSAPDSWWQILASYLFLPTFQATHSFPVLVVGWTLNYEMPFYALFAVALALRVPPLRVLLPTLGSVAAIAFLVGPGSTGMVVYEDSIVLEFLYGVILGQALLEGKVPGRVLSAALMLGGFAVLLAVHPTFAATRVVAWGLPALAIVTGAVGLEASLGPLVPAWLLETGDASYAIYLFHGFVLSLTGLVLARVGFGRVASIVIALVFGLFGSAVAGVGIHRAIEAPLASYFRERRAGRIVHAEA